MSYVDAFYDREKDIVSIVERDTKGKRHFKEHAAKYVFYYPDAKGKYTGTTGEQLSRVSCKNLKEFHKELRIHSGHKLYEQDIKPVYRCLEDNYLGQDAPKLNICFFDIEVDFDPERGYASKSTSISKKQMFSLRSRAWLCITRRCVHANHCDCCLPTMD